MLDVKEKERSLMVKARAEKYGRTKAFLQEQEHAFKSGQLGKGKKRSNKLIWINVKTCGDFLAIVILINFVQSFFEY